MSDNPEDNKKKEQPKTQSQDSSKDKIPEEKPAPQTQPPVSRPVVGTPIGARPVVGTSVGTRSTVGTPVGARPAIGTPVGTKPTGGTPVGTRPVVGTLRPAVGTSAQSSGTPPPPRPSVGAQRPSIGSPSAPGRPVVPQQPVQTKKDISRREFLLLLLGVGGAIIVGSVFSYPTVGFLDGSVSGTSSNPRQQLVATTGKLLKTTDIVTNNGQAMSLDDVAKGGAWQTFVYPYVPGNANTDADTFHQCVIVRLPLDLTAPAESFKYAVKDPLISQYGSQIGDTFVALSRVCVHLWCLWSYNPNFDKGEGEYVRRGQCPCHGSQYVPGYGPYPGFPPATNRLPGQAVAGPASLQTSPNNMLPLIQLDVDSSGNLYATGVVGQIGCGQLC